MLYNKITVTLSNNTILQIAKEIGKNGCTVYSSISGEPSYFNFNSTDLCLNYFLQIFRLSGISWKITR